MEEIIKSIRTELNKYSDEKKRIQGEKFFREKVRLYGLSSVQVKEISNQNFKMLPDKSKKAVFSLCEELWKNGYLEEAGIACMWSEKVWKQYSSDDFNLFEKWINKYVSNWAACDTFCNHSVGKLIEMYPEHLAGLKRWTKSDNRWVKRAAAVSLIIPARKGLYLSDIFEIADLVHSDPDDMVQKGYGWMLKVASQSHLKEVFEYVMDRRATMPRTALRYAIEKMPADLKARAMVK
jgi:3-methyladenine DNA glycosylase AlkD